MSSVPEVKSQNQTQMDSHCSTDHQNVGPPAWQRVPTLRGFKRKKVSSPSPEKITVTNSFNVLPTDVQEVNSYISKINSKPPPIILYGIEDVNKLTELLENVVNKKDFTFKIINKNQLRVSCNTVETYKKIIKVVRENGLIGHTFNRKDKRPYRIVIRNLHHTTPISVIKETLESTGNIVIGEIINAKYGPDRKPTSTFFATLEQGPSNKAAKNIKYIYYQSVVIEDPRKRNSVVQCQKCQQYGHTKNYCMRPYRCVKCAQSHKTADCPKTDRNTPATCALCLGFHPANYKGCEVYKEILARKFGKQTNIKLRGRLETDSNLNTDELPRTGGIDKTKSNIQYKRQRQTELY